MSDVPSSPIEPLRPLPDRSWRERLVDARERVRAGGSSVRVVAAVGAGVCVLVVAVALLRPAGADPGPEATLPRASESPAFASSASAPSPVPPLVVQAAGAVVRPGLYRLASGARVDDLVTAAGGMTADADPDRINLAAPVADGQKVYVPRVGEPIPAEVGASTSSGSAPQPIDLNTASVSQLDGLPGVGPSTAQAIVDYRSQHGRFRSVDDLLNVRGIGAAKLEQIRPLVRV